jgi:hypothetical protein
VILPEPAVRGRSYEIKIEYAGGRVIHNAAHDDARRNVNHDFLTAEVVVKKL